METAVAQALLELARVQPRDLGQQVVVEPATDREHAQEPLRTVGKPLDPEHQRVAQRPGEGAAAVEARSQELLHEQRVALRARVEAFHQLGCRRGAEDVAQRAGQLVTRQRRELDPAHARIALQLGKQWAERMAAVQLVEPIRGHDEHALVKEAPRQVGQERAGGAVGPMDVLQHEQDGGALAQVVQQREDGLEQSTLGARVAAGGGPIAQRRHEGSELGARGGGEGLERCVTVPRQRPKRRQERSVGKLAVAEVDALAGERVATAFSGAGDKLGHQPGLAHPGVACHESEGGGARFGVRERRLELGQLCLATDQAGTRDPSGHARSMAAGDSKNSRYAQSARRAGTVTTRSMVAPLYQAGSR